MELHRVRRLGEILVASQLRSGRSTSDPRSLLGRGIVIALADTGAFLAAFGLVEFVVAVSSVRTSTYTLLVNEFAPLLPIVSVAGVIIAGVMFELTTTTKFSGSDAANWLPITPTEYVAASATAIAYSYSPGVAFVLGGLLPIALAAGLLPTYVLAAALVAVGLLEGAALVEMVRAVTQRTSTIGSGRHARLSIVLRALLLIVLILIFDLAFNPAVVLGLVGAVSSFEWVTAAIPFVWSTQALKAWVTGDSVVALAFTAGQVAFLGLLVYLAGQLRQRWWVPSPGEVHVVAPSVRSGHPYLTAIGLSGPEAAIVSKDLRGYVRRREMLPTLVIPIVLVLLLVVEGGMFGGFGSIVWVGWVVGFFALLLSLTSIGQERRSLQALYACPITGRNVLRAKAAGVLFPALIAAVGMPVAVAALFRLPAVETFGFIAASLTAAIVLSFWGLAFAARFSDFQDRPRPQYLRPGAMLAALGSGMVILFSIYLPAAFVFLAPASSAFVLSLGAWAVTAALLAGGLALYLARTGFDQLFRQLPF